MANLKFPLLTLTLFLSAGGTLAFDPPTIPLNWTTVYPCAVDVPSRLLTGVVTTLLPNNSPAACIELCDSRDFRYAGVEYSNECHCGTGLAGTPESAPVSECDLPCSGDEDLACGGSWRVQIYKSPALPGGGWTLQGCFLDTPGAPAFASPVQHHTFPTNLDLVFQCVVRCQRVGLPWAGVEDAEDCQCSGAGLGAGAVRVGLEECDSLCPLPPGAGNQYCGGFERLMVYKYVGPS